MNDYILEMEHISKAFHGAKALSDVNLAVRRGEIHGLIGENGAGKTTLMNILSGVYPFGSYEGEVRFEGESCRFRGVEESERRGIVIVHQELSLIPSLSVAENLFIGNERVGRLGIDWEKTREEAKRAVAAVGLEVDPEESVERLGKGKQQLVEIARALRKEPRLLILDEPTSSLNEEESRRLLDLLLGLKEKGVTCVIISHKLHELTYVADTVTVIRDGMTIATMPNPDRELDEALIIRHMVGREMTSRYPAFRRNIQDSVALEVRDWTVHHPRDAARKTVDSVSFQVRQGEIVGIYGLQGSGRSRLGMSLFGNATETKIEGQMLLFGKEVRLRSIPEAIRAGLAYVSEDRALDGLILDETIAENITLSALDKVSRRGLVDQDKEREIADEYRGELGIKAASSSEIVRGLSGGNQQKVLLSKWMFSEPKILILDEPTRGIDVGAKYDVYTIIGKLAGEGKAIVMMSSELPEILGVCDRILVMHKGRIVARLCAKDADADSVMRAIVRSNKTE